MLGGGGARAAYQAGVLRGIASMMPSVHFPILTGVSAGAINAAYLANASKDFASTTHDLVQLWEGIRSEDVIATQGGPLVGNVLRWGIRLLSAGKDPLPPTRSMLDTGPLRRLLTMKLAATSSGQLPQLQRNIESGALEALAITSTNYATGQAVSWVSGRNPKMWQRPLRRSEPCEITVEHVMASTALPFFFPAIEIAGHWHGDGGIRLTAPLSPALHLGARKILAITTRRVPGVRPLPMEHANVYPSPAHILGILMNAIFLDNVDFDAANLERINRLFADDPNGRDGELRRVELFVIRPSEDLAAIASEFEFELPGALKYLTRGWGTQESRSSDSLAMLLFEAGYARRLIELGEADAERQADELLAFLSDDP